MRRKIDTGGVSMKKSVLMVYAVLFLFGVSLPAFASSGYSTLYAKVDTPMYSQPDLNSSLVVNTVWKGTQVDGIDEGKEVNGFVLCQVETVPGSGPGGFVQGYIPAVHLSSIKNGNNGGGSHPGLNGSWTCEKVISQDTYLKSEPTTRSSVISSLPAGAKIFVHTTEAGWAKVDYNRNTGYVATCYIKGWNTPDNYPEGTTSWYGGYDWSAVYDYAYYAQNNPDVVAALGNSPEACIRHFVEHGIHEGRQGNRSFNVSIYMDQHSEEVKKYGYKDKSVFYKLVCGIPF